MRLVRNQLVAVLLLTLVSCDQADLQSADASRVDDCLDLPIYPPPGITDRKQAVHACVERNAAMYAKGSDSPATISEAVAVKCQEAIIRFVEEAAAGAGEEPQYKVALEAWRKHSLPVIAEARARKCYS